MVIVTQLLPVRVRLQKQTQMSYAKNKHCLKVFGVSAKLEHLAYNSWVADGCFAHLGLSVGTRMVPGEYVDGMRLESGQMQFGGPKQKKQHKKTVSNKKTAKQIEKGNTMRKKTTKQTST